ncbi:hypothetical protein AVEN_127195-1 [Araneus ventricosus]|uniref:Uncharacterized protein n=1 Tax=Araneus ventricosus TaxID=182803 RepID=A0A4Y2LXK5_ARAVE|nr:hypothetical protein AVEN_127195-1 [Araneus ventricosus]
MVTTVIRAYILIVFTLSWHVGKCDLRSSRSEVHNYMNKNFLTELSHPLQQSPPHTEGCGDLVTRILSSKPNSAVDLLQSNVLQMVRYGSLEREAACSSVALVICKRFPIKKSIREAPI